MDGPKQPQCTDCSSQSEIEYWNCHIWYRSCSGGLSLPWIKVPVVTAQILQPITDRGNDWHSCKPPGQSIKYWLQLITDRLLISYRPNLSSQSQTIHTMTTQRIWPITEHVLTAQSLGVNHKPQRKSRIGYNTDGLIKYPDIQWPCTCTYGANHPANHRYATNSQ